MKLLAIFAVAALPLIFGCYASYADYSGGYGYRYGYGYYRGFEYPGDYGYYFYHHLTSDLGQHPIYWRSYFRRRLYFHQRPDHYLDRSHSNQRGFQFRPDHRFGLGRNFGRSRR
jgi:hypothetical protein